MNNHITEIEIKNFKKFEHLVVKNIGQLNLITGNNNVGKTCLLEGLLVNDNIDKSIENLHRTLCNKNVHIHPTAIQSKNPKLPLENYFEYLKNDKNKDISFKWKIDSTYHLYQFQDISLKDLNEVDFKAEIKHNYNIGRPNMWIKVYKDEKFRELQFMYLDDFKRDLQYGYIPLVYKNAGFNRDINQFYAENIGLDVGEAFISSDNHKDIKSLNYNDKQKFIKNLAFFFSDIEDVTIKNYFQRDILSIKLKKHEDFTPITFLGEGVNEYIRYILEIQKCKSNRLMIDEIGTGIHHSKLAEFWKVIFQVAQNEDVQLFCTTHSQECIEAFVRASYELQNDYKDKIRLIELEESQNTNKIYSSTYTYDQISTGIDSDVNLRG